MAPLVRPSIVDDQNCWVKSFHTEPLHKVSGNAPGGSRDSMSQLPPWCDRNGQAEGFAWLVSPRNASLPPLTSVMNRRSPESSPFESNLICFDTPLKSIFDTKSLMSDGSV